MLSLHTPWPTLFMLVLATVATLVGQMLVRSTAISNNTYSYVVMPVAWGLVVGLLTAFWTARRSFKARVAALCETIRGRDPIAFEQQLEAMVAVERRAHYFLASEEREAPNLVRCLALVRASCRLVAERNWPEAYAVSAEGTQLLAGGSLNLLHPDDASEIRRILTLNGTAAQNYAGPRLAPSDHYELEAIAIRVNELINHPSGSIAEALPNVVTIAGIALTASGVSNDVTSSTRACLTDALLLGCIGILLQQPELAVADPALAERLRIDPDLVKRSGAVLVKVGPMLDAALSASLGKATSDIIESTVARWKESEAIPSVFVRVNGNLLRDAPPVEYYRDEQILASAHEYFRDELAVTRINMCAACLRSGEFQRYQPLIERLLTDLTAHRSGAFYSEGIVQLGAIRNLIFGNSEGAVAELEELGQSAKVYAVRQSALRTLETFYAQHRRGEEFLRIKAALASAASLKGIVYLDQAMALAAQRPPVFAGWHFISLPSRRIFWPVVRAPFARATA